MSSIQANVSPPSLPLSTPSDSPTSLSRSHKDDALAPNPAGTEHPTRAAALLLDAVRDVRQIIRLLQCPICSRIIQEPTTLPCGKSICRSCRPPTHVRTNISWPATENRLRGFECPFPDCRKEHAAADCAVDVTMNKALTFVKAALELERDGSVQSEVSTYVEVQGRWDVAGIPSMEEKEKESRVLKGGRVVATYTLAELGKLDYGCEVSFSTVDAGNDEIEAVDTAIFHKLKESFKTEMDCQVCYALFLDPLTTTCGHTFCRSCLHRILDHSDMCPICRRGLSMQSQLDPQSVPSNDRLCSMINGFWADKVALRSQAHRLEQQANHGGFDIPLFVCTLSFPSMPLFLHVFEPRYRLMIRRAMEADRTFGMVMAKPQNVPGEANFMELGTLLRIVSIEFFPDGRSLLETVGVSRFRVTRDGWLDGYAVANIAKLDDISVAEEEAIEASETMRGVGVRTFTSPTEPRDPAHPQSSGPVRSPPVPISLDDLETMSTQELVDVGINFVTRMRAQSVAWLAARVLAIYGDCPTDPAIFPWWFASILPVKEEEKLSYTKIFYH
ncbi:Uu.00g082420.m01.CDS01 [Anthostomella pinea]|uniref:Uu.00g082420.m01.CDS01 n=1 Tax=Anthostomella pinea TaxID=933095 RepID=A0AAI8VLC2_9PEZI|nr:Uu.00g082420.m01.CDS01 [Anthostomella pinea]